MKECKCGKHKPESKKSTFLFGVMVGAVGMFLLGMIIVSAIVQNCQ